GAAVAAARRHAGALVAVLAASGAVAAPIVLRAEVAVGPLFSWQPVAAALAATPPETDVVFEAPEEYQIVAGLAYYTRRRITLLEPPGFVPPTYLAGHTGEMFVPRAEFARRWGSGRPVALLGVVLFLDQKDEIRYMLAPDLQYNRTKGVFPTFRLFGYPTPLRRYSILIGKSTTKDEDYELEFSDRGYWEGRAFILASF